MAYDRDLAARVRMLLRGEPLVEEKAMFGGLAFLVGGHLAVAAASQGGLLLRVDPAEADALVEHDGVTRFVMRGRALAGWLAVAPDVVATEEPLAAWSAHGVRFARSLT